jgi:hypothetical protein
MQGDKTSQSKCSEHLMHLSIISRLTMAYDHDTRCANLAASLSPARSGWAAALFGLDVIALTIVDYVCRNHQSSVDTPRGTQLPAKSPGLSIGYFKSLYSDPRQPGGGKN